MATKTVTDQSFASDVLGADGAVLVDFWAEWCGPCRMIAPALEEIAKDLGEKVTIAKLNIDENPDTPGRYGVRGIPPCSCSRADSRWHRRLERLREVRSSSGSKESRRQRRRRGQEALNSTIRSGFSRRSFNIAFALIDYGGGAPYIARDTFPRALAGGFRPFLSARVFKGIPCSPQWQRASSDRPTTAMSEVLANMSTQSTHLNRQSTRFPMTSCAPKPDDFAIVLPMERSSTV